MDGNAPIRAADASLAVSVVGILGWLPAVVTVIAGILACIWYGLDIYDRLQRRKHVATAPSPLLVEVISATKEQANVKDD